MANRPTYVWTGSEWDTIADPGAVRKALVTAKGQIIGASASGTPAVVSAGTDGHFLVADSGSTAGAKFANSVTGNLSLSSSTSYNPLLTMTNETNDANSPFVILRKNRAGAIVQNGDTVGIVSFRGYNGSSYDELAAIWGQVDGTPGASSDMPGRLAFYTTADGASNLTERMRIDATGRVKLPAGGVLEAPVSTNAQTTSYTLVLTDAGRLIEINSASATTLTIPADASVAFPVGTKIDVLQTGAGQVTIAGSGFTPNATPGLKISAQWGAATLVKRGTNSWVVIGNLSA